MNTINSQFVMSLSIILLGYFLKKVNILKESDGEVISRLIFNVTLPSIVINVFSTMTIDKSLLLVPVISFVFGLIMAVVALIVFKGESRREKGMLTMLVPSFNVGLFAYPIVESIWGRSGLKYFGMFDMGNSFIVFAVCYIIASIYSSSKGEVSYKNIFAKTIHSIPFLTYIITLAINLLGLSIPKPIIQITGILSKANMPLALLALGLYLSFSFKKTYLKNMAKIIALRYIIGFGVGILIYNLVPLDPMFKKTMLIGLILPISFTVIPYSVEFDYDTRFVGTVNNLTIIISFILMWAIIAFV
ncbi:AEC family transporter [Clostridium estertheticum]|uniref:AEC family transporter n=1 Tax=Clostridium estertheticum TaxID=238834 RepID=UPI001CF558E2|nr:AEC family transporter [Clostridium estertheticum]MCB2358162.1 AEC family transporter [Clostridium estertheticum]